MVSAFGYDGTEEESHDGSSRSCKSCVDGSMTDDCMIEIVGDVEDRSSVEAIPSKPQDEHLH